MTPDFKASSKLQSSPPAAPQREAVDLPPRGKRILISIFLLFHLVAITVWAMPISTPLTSAVKEEVRPYLVWSGLFQSWDLFSPSPKSINSFVDAVVVFKDGSSKIWTFPRMEQLSLTDRYMKERYRKFVEVLKEDSMSPLWPDAARFVARLNNDPHDPVQTVQLVRHWSEIVPARDGQFVGTPWRAYPFFSYTVKPEDLK